MTPMRDFEGVELPDLFGFDINCDFEAFQDGGGDQQQQVQIQEQQPMELEPIDQVWIAIKIHLQLGGFHI